MRAAEQAVARLKARVAVRVRALLPDARVGESDASVSVEARGLRRRWVENPELSWWRQ